MAKIEILESAQRELEAIAELHMNLVGRIESWILFRGWNVSLCLVRFQEMPNC